MTRPFRFVLGALLGFGALNAFGGGWYGLAGAEGVPTAWLDGSPFSTYVVPSLILLVVVGGAFAAAAALVLAGSRRGRTAALLAAGVVLGWIAVQVAIIGHVSWMQPATAIAGLVIAALAWWAPQAPSSTARTRSSSSTGENGLGSAAGSAGSPA